MSHARNMYMLTAKEVQEIRDVLSDNSWRHELDWDDVTNLCNTVDAYRAVVYASLDFFYKRTDDAAAPLRAALRYAGHFGTED